MQRLTPDYFSYIDEVTIEKYQTQMIRSKKRSVMLNDASIPEYYVAKRVGPSLSPISIDSLQKAFLTHLVRPICTVKVKV